MTDDLQPGESYGDCAICGRPVLFEPAGEGSTDRINLSFPNTPDGILAHFSCVLRAVRWVGRAMEHLHFGE